MLVRGRSFITNLAVSLLSAVGSLGDSPTLLEAAKHKDIMM